MRNGVQEVRRQGQEEYKPPQKEEVYKCRHVWGLRPSPGVPLRGNWVRRRAASLPGWGRRAVSCKGRRVAS